MIQKCFSECTVIGAYSVGGFIGYNSYIIRYCYAAGGVTGEDTVGGFIGHNNGTHGRIEDCYARSNVVCDGVYAAGFCALQGDID